MGSEGRKRGHAGVTVSKFTENSRPRTRSGADAQTHLARGHRCRGKPLFGPRRPKATEGPRPSTLGVGDRRLGAGSCARRRRRRRRARAGVLAADVLLAGLVRATLGGSSLAAVLPSARSRRKPPWPPPPTVLPPGAPFPWRARPRLS